MNSDNLQEMDNMRNSLVTIATEAFRFDNTFWKMLEKLDFEDRKKYLGQYEWFCKKLKNALNTAGIDVVDIKGQVYDPGMAVVPLNIDEFDPDNELVIDYLIEPIIMKDGKTLKEGTALLKLSGGDNA